MTEEEKKEHDVPYKDGKSPFKPPLYLQRYNFANGFKLEKQNFTQMIYLFFASTDHCKVSV